MNGYSHEEFGRYCGIPLEGPRNTSGRDYNYASLLSNTQLHC
jgi:hypothetical protein